MKVIGMVCVIALLAVALPASASSVFRCKTPAGKVYYSDKGCKAGDAYAESSGKGNMSVFHGKEMAGSAPRSAPRPAATGSSPSIGPRYIQRANTGAARADEKLNNKK